MVKFKRIPLTPESTKLLRSLQKACLPIDAPYLMKTGAYWVGYWKGVPIAFCVVAPSIQWADCVYLARSGVLDDYQGYGLQKKMITLRERWARKHGFKWVVTDTSENPASANSLIARGYKIYEPQKPWGLSRAIYWRKKL